MPIEMRCAGCGQMLRVADEHAGKKARCPACGTVADVPLPAGQSPLVEPGSPFMGQPPLGAESGSPFADKPHPAEQPGGWAERRQPEINPYATPAAPRAASAEYLRPHRGGLVLTFGILGILCCMPLGIAAWVMGASDLSEIRAGRMDPNGETLTRVGMILGIVSVGFAILWFVINVLAALAAGG